MSTSRVSTTKRNVYVFEVASQTQIATVAGSRGRDVPVEWWSRIRRPNSESQKRRSLQVESPEQMRCILRRIEHVEQLESGSHSRHRTPRSDSLCFHLHIVHSFLLINGRDLNK